MSKFTQMTVVVLALVVSALMTVPAFAAPVAGAGVPVPPPDGIEMEIVPADDFELEYKPIARDLGRELFRTLPQSTTTQVVSDVTDFATNTMGITPYIATAVVIGLAAALLARGLRAGR